MYARRLVLRVVTQAGGGRPLRTIPMRRVPAAALLVSALCLLWAAMPAGASRVAGWGDNTYNQSGHITAIAASTRGEHSLALTEVGEVLAWGLALTQASSLAATIECVSVNSEGETSNGSCLRPSISGDGRYVAFGSSATNLVPGDTNAYYDIFVHDRLTGETERVSVSSTGEEANYNSEKASISADGRYVAFVSAATNLVPDDTNLADDIFVHDRETGTTEIVNLTSSGEQANRDSNACAISGDGRYVAFSTHAINFFSGDSMDLDVFVRDRETAGTVRASQSFPEDCGPPAITNDGLYVAFADGDNVMLRDYSAGQYLTVSVNPDGDPGQFPGVEDNDDTVGISADGRYVVFHSEQIDLVPDDTNLAWDIFIRDMDLGVTERLTVNSEGQEVTTLNAHRAVPPAVSADGRFVVFVDTYRLVPEDLDTTDDLYLRDRLTGTIEQIGTSASWADISDDGQIIAFASGQIYVWKRLAADFTANPTSGPAPLTVDFTDLSTGGPTSWSWDFGDGGTSTEQHPSHEYLDPGTHTVSLTAANAGGEDTETKTDYVTAGFAMPEVLLEVHPNEAGQGYGGGPKLGTECWTSSGLTGPFYLWKQYQFEGSADLWIQVCGQNFNNLQNSSGKGDMLQLKIDGQVPDDVWGIMTGWSGVAQWRGDNEHGDRYTLEFQPTGLSAGQHVLKLAAKETPIIWWIKVTDLEAQRVSPPE